MWTAPRRGKPSAPGQIRAITVITADDQKDFEVEPRRKKTLQGQPEKLKLPLRNNPFVVIVGEDPVNVTRNNIIAVIPTWGPIYEFTFDMRINVFPGPGPSTSNSQCLSGDTGAGMIMRLGADGPSTTTRTAQSMAPIVHLGMGRIHICIHNQTNPNTAVSTIWRQRYEVCGNGCVGPHWNNNQRIFSTQDYIGMTSCIMTQSSAVSFFHLFKSDEDYCQAPVPCLVPLDLIPNLNQ